MRWVWHLLRLRAEADCRQPQLTQQTPLEIQPLPCARCGLAASTEAAIETFLASRNTGSFTTDAYTDAPATFTAFTGRGASCCTPTS